MKFVTADLHLLHKNVLKFDSSQKHRGQYKGNLDSMHRGIITTWNKKRYGARQLYGHDHGTGTECYGRQMDCGWDLWGRLLTLEEAYNMTGALPVLNKHC